MEVGGAPEGVQGESRKTEMHCRSKEEETLALANKGEYDRMRGV